MAENGAQLTPQQQRAIASLLTAKNIREAAILSKVPERTLTRWLVDPSFVVALRQAEGAMLDAATRRLLQHQDVAITVILSIMADKQYPAGVRLRAAMAIIDTMLRLRELNSVEQRLAALEATAYAQK